METRSTRQGIEESGRKLASGLNASGSTATVIGNFLLFAGLFLLLMGSTTTEGGTTKIGFGIAAALLGAVIAAASSRKSAA